ncbi:MAG: WG repeat-containing protein [Tissierellaceae bacterium]|nr:WG repeat-containing protein [Tissierellaceae bacterium]
MKKHLKLTLILIFLITFITGVAHADDEIKLIEEPFKSGQTYSMIWAFSEGRAVVRHGSFYNGKWGFIDENGEEVIPCIYDFALDFSEGLARVKRGGKAGYIDKNGEVVIPFVFNDGGSFIEGLAPVTNEDGKRGYIDKSGKLVIPYHYIYAGQFSEGLARVSGDYFNTPLGMGHIDKTGKIVTAFKYEEVGAFSEGLAFYRKDYKFGFINKNDDIVIIAKYDSVRSFDNGIAPVCYEGKWGFIDTKGKTVLEFQYDYIHGYIGGLCGVYKDGKWGFIDENFEIVIPLIYDQVGGFSEGICSVAKKDEYDNLKWGYIDKTGEELSPLIYNDITVVRNGVATVNNSSLLRVVKGSTPIKETVAEKPKDKTALPNKLKVLIDGKEISIGSYLIDDTSYYKLRDIAYALKSTPKYFNVYWDNYANSILLSSGLDYIAVGGEMAEVKDTKISAVPSNSKLYINHKQENLECYTIEGYNYFKLRDLGKYLMFDVDYNNEKRQIEINTSEKLGVSIRDIKITLGDSLSRVSQVLGQPDRIDDKVTNLKWYVYNKDYSKFVMIGFSKDKVAAIYTSHTNFVVNDTIKYGEFEENLPSSPNIDYYIDVFGGKILYGVMIKEESSISLWKTRVDKEEILPIYEFQEFDCLNSFRVFKGLNPLKIDEIALKSAREHSKDMAENNYFEHVGLDGRSHYNRYWDNNGKHFPYAENLAAGDQNGFDQFKGLLNSPGHRANMVISDADYVGIGVYYKEDSEYKFYGTQAFTRNH